jgi:hypothetical protein
VDAVTGWRQYCDASAPNRPDCNEEAQLGGHVERSDRRLGECVKCTLVASDSEERPVLSRGSVKDISLRKVSASV